MSATLLDDVLAKLKALPPEKQAELRKIAERDIKTVVWRATPGPQLDAINCQADVLLYGGEAGGGKTDLDLGLAFTEHKRSLILRREYTDLGAITERAIEINRTKRGFNGSPPPSLKTADGRLIEFGAAKNLGDEQGFQGNPHDLIVYDEAVHFAETQVRFLWTWCRSTDPKQRCRIVLTTNPPVDVEGEWLIRMFAPWLDPQHREPAKPGELRWYISDVEGKDLEVEDGRPVLLGDRFVKPMSRTFIPAGLKDNPFLAKTDYAAKLDSLPEPYRSAYRDGNFMLAKKDDARQLIPTEWVRAAQGRWTPTPPRNIPMCAIGVDVAAGGDDQTVLAPRHDNWFAPLIAVPGRQTPKGADVAGLVVAHRTHGCPIIVDMGGGFGGAAFEAMEANDLPVVAYKGATGTAERTRDNQLGFTNTRSLAYWRVREMLDPSQPGGSNAALPPDNELVSDLTAVTFTVTSQGIKALPKEDVIKKLGRSPDKGDAVVIAWTDGPKASTHASNWLEHGIGERGGRAPKVNMGHADSRRPR